MVRKISKSKMELDSLTLAMIVVGLLIIVTALYTIPIGSGRDVYVKYTVEKPIIGGVKFTSLSVVSHPHTLMTSPMAGASWIPGYDLLMGGIGAVALSGEVTIKADAGAISKSENIGQLIRMTTKDGTVVLTDVPVDVKELFVSVSESNKVIETQKVILP